MAERNHITTSRPAPILPAPALFEHFSDRATQITGRMPDNSMAPKLQEGDLLQIEPCDEIGTGGAMYAFEIDGRQYVRSLALGIGGEVIAYYADPVRGSDTLPASEVHRIKLIGRVVGVLQYRSVI